MKKRIAAALLLFVFGFSFVPAAAAEETEKITLEEAVKLAVENSTAYAAAVLAVEKEELSYLKADDNYDDARFGSYYASLTEYLILNEQLDSGDTSVSDRLDDLEDELRKTSAGDSAETIADMYDILRDAEDDYDDAKENLEDYREELEGVLEEEFTAILQAERLEEIYEKECELALLEMNLEKKKLELGLASADDVAEAELSYSGKCNSLTSLRYSLKTLKGDLNTFIGQEYMDEISPAEIEIPETAVIPAYNDLLTDLQNGSSALDDLKRDIEDLNDDLDDVNTEEEDYGEETISLEIESKVLDMADEETSLQKEAYDLISDLQEKQNLYRHGLIEYETAENDYLLAQKKYELGLLSYTGMLTAEKDFLTAERTMYQTGYDFSRAVRDLELAG